MTDQFNNRLNFVGKPVLTPEVERKLADATNRLFVRMMAAGGKTKTSDGTEVSFASNPADVLRAVVVEAGLPVDEESFAAARAYAEAEMEKRDP